MSAQSRSRRGLAAALTLCGALIVTAAQGAPATAGSPHQVDPDALQPPLNPDFAPWSCWTAGRGIVCQGDFKGSWSEPLGLECDGQPVYTNGGEDSQMTRWHTADGLAVKTVVNIDTHEVFSFSPVGSGPAVATVGRWNRLYTYPVPGDLGSRILTETGLNWRWTGPDGGVVFRDTGFVRFAPGEDFETITAMHGIHDFYDDPDGLDQTICVALT